MILIFSRIPTCDIGPKITHIWTFGWHEDRRAAGVEVMASDCNRYGKVIAVES